jgi:hypothetical protein
MRERKTRLGFFVATALIFLASLIVALFDPADRPSHVRAYIYGAGVLIGLLGMFLTIRRKI